MISIKNFSRVLLVLAATIMLYGCKSASHITYLNGVESLTDTQLAKSSQQFSAKIKPNDLLRIVVSGAEDADTYYPFNLMVAMPSNENSTQSVPTLLSYLVDNKGTIDFPVLGNISVANLTTGELSRQIAEMLRNYLKADLVVTVRFANYKISVMGEVTRPGVYTVKDENVNILQALSMAGDLTIYGRRDVVKILREGANGQKSITTLNLNDKNLIFSPYFYLQQNDVVYVEPNKAKAKGASVGAATNVWFSVASIIIGVASLVVTVAR